MKSLKAIGCIVIMAGSATFTAEATTAQQALKNQAKCARLGETVNLSALSFKYKSSDLIDSAKSSLTPIGKTLRDCPKLAIKVAGHTDNVGSAQYNLKLSQQRADSVKNYLIRSGAAAAQVEAAGFGLSKPIADNKTKQGRADNRRVELTYVAPPAPKIVAKAPKKKVVVPAKPKVMPKPKPVVKKLPAVVEEPRSFAGMLSHSNLKSCDRQ